MTTPRAGFYNPARRCSMSDSEAVPSSVVGCVENCAPSRSPLTALSFGNCACQGGVGEGKRRAPRSAGCRSGWHQQRLSPLDPGARGSLDAPTMARTPVSRLAIRDGEFRLFRRGLSLNGDRISRLAKPRLIGFLLPAGEAPPTARSRTAACMETVNSFRSWRWSDLARMARPDGARGCHAINGADWARISRNGKATGRTDSARSL